MDITVLPEYLRRLAKMHNEAVCDAEQATTTTVHLTEHVWTSWGVSSGEVNTWFVKAEHARRAAGEAIQKACSDLASNLHAAANLYERIDTESGANFTVDVASQEAMETRSLPGSGLAKRHQETWRRSQ